MCCRALRIASISLLMCFAVVIGVQAGPVFVDDFNDGTLNSSVWDVRMWGTGPTVVEQNGRLEITFAQGCKDDPSVGAIQAGIWTKWKLTGDYDIQVDYLLLEWPYGNGTHVALDAAACQARVSGGPDWNEPREVYEMGPVTVATSDQSGKLREVKTGDNVTGYYYSQGSWIPLFSHGTSNDVDVNLRAWTHQVVFTGPVKIAYDNFTLNSGQIVPEPSGLLGLMLGASGMLGAALRRRKS